MSQSDLWEKAAECTRAIEATSDPQTRQVLTNLLELWISLANESQITSASGSHLAEQIKTASQLHAGLILPTIN